MRSGTLCFKMADKDPDCQIPQHNAPHGMEPYDVSGEGNLGALSKDQQEKLNKYKVRMCKITEKIKSSKKMFVLSNTCSSTS